MVAMPTESSDDTPARTVEMVVDITNAVKVVGAMVPKGPGQGGYGRNRRGAHAAEGR